MKCTSCQFENRDGIRFCENCGTELPQASSTEAAPAYSQPVQAAGLTCPNCGALNPADMSFCTQCGSRLQPIVAAPQNIFCTQCGAPNPADYQYCNKCGNVLFDGPHIKSPRRASNLGQWALAGASIVILAGIAFGVWNYLQMPRPASPQQPVYEEVVIQEEAPPESPNTSSDPNASGNAAPPEVQGSSPVQPEPQQNPPDKPNAAASASQPDDPDHPEDLPLLGWDVVPYEPYKCENCGGYFEIKDTDQDGLYDHVEEMVAQMFAPYYIYDEDEIWRRPCGGIREVFGNSCVTLGGPPPPINWIYQARPGRVYDDQNGRAQGYCIEGDMLVPCVESLDSKPYILLVITALYDMDYVEPVSDTSILWHLGDTESVEIYIECQSGDCNQEPYWPDMIQINRHSEGHAYDQKYVSWVNEFGQGNIAGATHPVLYISQGKHAAYVNSNECRDAEFEGGIDEQCNGGWMGVPPLAGLPTNVGEINFPNMAAQDFINIVFPGERIWDRDYAFCGGYTLSYEDRQGGSYIGAEYITGLDIDDFWIPFWEDKYAPNCSGSTGSKWYPFDVFAENRERPIFLSPMETIQMGFVDYLTSDDICMVNVGTPVSPNPSEGANNITELLGGERMYYGQMKTFNVSPNTPYWFSFVSCGGSVIYQDILSCEGNCLFNVPP